MIVKMPGRFSVYLDLLRVTATATVMFSHFPLLASHAAVTDRFNFGYDAVIVFFVLSGYVISHAVDTKETNGFIYAVNRVARIFPVAVVAVLLSLVLMILGHARNPQFHPDSFQLQSIAYYLARTLSFTNEFWWDDILPFGNRPYWSLALEVWCYVIYGLVMFTRGRMRICAVLIALILTGPKQWLMLPIWFAGVAAYAYRDRFTPGRASLWLSCLCPVALFFAIQLNNPRDWSYPWVGIPLERILGHGLDGAANVGWGSLLALLVAVHLWAVRQLTVSLAPRTANALDKTIQRLAAYTFTLYICHAPLVQFWRGQLDQTARTYDPLQTALVYAGVLIPVFILGELVERRKRQFRNAIIATLNACKRLWVPRTAGK